MLHFQQQIHPQLSNCDQDNPFPGKLKMLNEKKTKKYIGSLVFLQETKNEARIQCHHHLQPPPLLSISIIHLIPAEKTLVTEKARDVIITAMENASWSQTKLATHIKKAFDNSFGAAWHVGFLQAQEVM